MPLPPPSPGGCRAPLQIYTGDETKVRVKQQSSRVKNASVEAVVNGIVLRIVFVLGAVCLVGALCSLAFVNRAVGKHAYLAFSGKAGAALFFQVGPPPPPTSPSLRPPPPTLPCRVDSLRKWRPHAHARTTICPRGHPMRIGVSGAPVVVGAWWLTWVLVPLLPGPLSLPSSNLFGVASEASC